MEGDAVEAALIAYYQGISFSIEEADRLRRAVRDALGEQEKAAKLLQQRLAKELDRLDRQEANLVELAADGSLPTDKVKQRLREVQRQRRTLEEQSERGSQPLQDGAELLEKALLLLEAPGELFARMAPEQRRLLQQALFEKLYISDERSVKVAGAVFKVPFGDLVAARRAAAQARSTGQTVSSEGGELGLLVPILLGDGSKSSGLVVLRCPYSNPGSLREQLNELKLILRQVHD